MDLAADLRRRLEDMVVLTISANPPVIAKSLLGAAAMLQAPGTGANHALWGRWIVAYSLRQPSPSTFCRLVKDVDVAGALPEVHEIVATLKADPSAWEAPAEQGLYVPQNWPFIDRRPVRDILTDMAMGRPGAPAALAIEGPYGHGKRTIGCYIERLAQETKTFVAANVEIRREPQRGMLLKKMVSTLSVALGIEPDLMTTHVEPERQAAVHVNTLALNALAAPSTAWFVANIIDHRFLEAGVLTFVDELLAVSQGMSELIEKLRVVVVCDQLSLLELENAPPLTARRTLTQVSVAEIREWLEAAVPGKSAGLYDVAASGVMADLEQHAPEDHERLMFIATKCRTAQQQLASTPLV